MLEDNGIRLLIEHEVDRINGLKIVIYSDEHPPPHFLVKCSDGSCRFTISDCSPLDSGLSKFHKNVKHWHQKNKALLIEVWNRSRPSDCPVGRYEDETSGEQGRG
ncbi:MAG: DUF4160 domain-containing protein [Xanthomonadales bacterium]|nr:DUF4160 domain-containing protein [Xanthomonadales bacterium]